MQVGILPLVDLGAGASNKELVDHLKSAGDRRWKGWVVAATDPQAFSFNVSAYFDMRTAVLCTRRGKALRFG